MSPELVDAAISGLIFAVMALVFFWAIAAIRAVWRWVKSLSIHGAARAAGQITAATERRSADIVQAFKEGRDRSSRP